MLFLGRYKAFGLTAALMAASTKLLSQPSNMKSVQPPLLHSMKLECPDGLVHLSSDSSRGELFNVSLPIPATNTPVSNFKYNEISKSVFKPNGSSGHSNFSRPPFHPNTQKCPSVMQCLKSLASIPRSKNKLASIDYDKIIYYKVQYLPPSYNRDVLFELPPSCIFDSISKNTMDGMDKQFNGNIWCHTISFNMYNSQGLIFRKSSCVGQLVYKNQSCDFFSRSSEWNETEWLGQFNTPFNLGQSPPRDSTLVCKVCKVLPTRVNFCNACIYYAQRKGEITRVCIHLGMHNHQVFDGIFQEILDTISGLIAQEVSKTPTAKNSAITMATSKEFLDGYLIHNGLGPKEMLGGKALEDVLDKFETLSSPNLRNMISLS
jgi:hypothetical protein